MSIYRILSTIQTSGKKERKWIEREEGREGGRGRKDGWKERMHAVEFTGTRWFCSILSKSPTKLVEKKRREKEKKSKIERERACIRSDGSTFC